MNELEHLYSLTEDTTDDAKTWAFAIADVLWHHDSSMVPDDWQFTHSPVCDSPEEWPDSEIHEFFTSGRITVDELIALGNQLVEKGWQ